jgi:hypothetical protein
MNKLFDVSGRVALVERSLVLSLVTEGVIIDGSGTATNNFLAVAETRTEPRT